MNVPDIQRIISWLVDGARSAATPTDMMADVCNRMVEAGLPLWRVGVFIRTLHPDIFGRSFVWRQGDEVKVGAVDFDFLNTPEFIQSPLKIVFEERIEIRRRIDDPASRRFPILDDM